MLIIFSCRKRERILISLNVRWQKHWCSNGVIFLIATRCWVLWSSAETTIPERNEAKWTMKVHTPVEFYRKRLRRWISSRYNAVRLRSVADERTRRCLTRNFHDSLSRPWGLCSASLLLLLPDCLTSRVCCAVRKRNTREREIDNVRSSNTLSKNTDGASVCW